MSYFPLPNDLLRVGDATPFALHDQAGKLLMPRGTLIATEAQLALLLARGVFVLEQDREALNRAINHKLDAMVRGNALIGRIAQARPDRFGFESAEMKRLENPVEAWSRLQLRLASLLRDPAQAGFHTQLQAEAQHLLALTDADPDMALLLLVHGAMQEVREYSVTHAMLVAVVCELAGRRVGAWPAEWLASLRGAALTMNIGMTQLQNQLAAQETPPTPEQHAAIRDHGPRGADLLRHAGIEDALWLAAVAQHHGMPPGPLAELPPAGQLARLIQRADIFTARLSRRKTRAALPAGAPVGADTKAIYLDENRQPDEAGAAIIQAIGIYPPGCLVRLASGEVAIVLRRGPHVRAPRVVALANAQGLPLGEPILRNTGLPAHGVTGGVSGESLKVRIDVEALIRFG